MASREIERGGVLAHQHGGLLQALPGRRTGEALLQGGGPHPRVGQEAIDPLGLSPADRGLRDGIARPLRERFQDAGQAGRKPFVRQHRSRCHPRCPECVRMHSASPTRYQNVLSAAPFLLSTPYPLSRSRSSQKLWVMLRGGGRAVRPPISSRWRICNSITRVTAGTRISSTSRMATICRTITPSVRDWWTRCCSTAAWWAT